MPQSLMSASSQVTSGDKHARQSRFYFADLGGSEQLSKSKVDAETKAKVLVPWLENHRRNHQRKWLIVVLLLSLHIRRAESPV